MPEGDKGYESELRVSSNHGMFRSFSSFRGNNHEVSAAAPGTRTLHTYALPSLRSPCMPNTHALPARQDLPTDWRRASDDEGNEYFYNAKTKESQYDRPLPLPRDWLATKDKKSGQVYYYNKKTKETSWTRPHGDDGGPQTRGTSASAEDLSVEPGPPEGSPPGT